MVCMLPVCTVWFMIKAEFGCCMLHVDNLRMFLHVLLSDLAGTCLQVYH